MRQSSYLAACLQIAAAGLLLIFPALAAWGQDYTCGTLQADHQVSNYWDASPAARKHIQLVEQFHLGPSVLNLSKPGGVIGDLDYTLRHVPNHPYALDAIIRLNRQQGGELPQLPKFSWRRSVDCFIQRALQLDARNATIHMLYGLYHHRDGRLDDALAAYLQSQELDSKSPELQYNLGLLYFDREEYDQALTHAKRAYALGYPLPGLRNKLQQVGKWQ